MFWESLGMLGILTLWGAFGLVPWCAALIVGRGRGALVALPLAFAAGVGGGVLAPALGGNGALGFGISLLTAMTGGGIASAVVVIQATNAAGRES